MYLWEMEFAEREITGNIETEIKCLICQEEFSSLKRSLLEDDLCVLVCQNEQCSRGSNKNYLHKECANKLIVLQGSAKCLLCKTDGFTLVPDERNIKFSLQDFALYTINLSSYAWDKTLPLRRLVGESIIIETWRDLEGDKTGIFLLGCIFVLPLIQFLIKNSVQYACKQNYLSEARYCFLSNAGHGGYKIFWYALLFDALRKYYANTDGNYNRIPYLILRLTLLCGNRFMESLIRLMVHEFVQDGVLLKDKFKLLLGLLYRRKISQSP